MTDIRIVVTNTSGQGGTFLTPMWFGFHDSNFDLFNRGEAASAGLEAIAEDGSFDAIAPELTAADADAQGGIITGAAGPIATGERTSTIVNVNAASNGYLSLAAMILPSNDAFIGTGNALEIFDETGKFKGAQTITFDQSNAYDAGTEVNTEMDAAFINQTAPNTGVDENGVITLHPGFNGSAGNPGGEQIILGGTNAFGEPITAEAADFTLPGNTIATVHVNTVKVETGTDGRDFLRGGSEDNIYDGGDGNDILYGGAGWDELSGDNGRDILFGGAGSDVLSGGAGRDFLFGGADDDLLDGGEGRDFLSGGRGNDMISGGDGHDFISAGSGDDVVSGGAGRDTINLGRGSDTFIFAAGDGRDKVRSFDDDDTLVLSIEGIDNYDDLVATARESYFGTTFDFGDGDAINLRGVWLDDLSSAQFDFV